MHQSDPIQFLYQNRLQNQEFMSQKKNPHDCPTCTVLIPIYIIAKHVLKRKKTRDYSREKDPTKTITCNCLKEWFTLMNVFTSSNVTF